MEAAIAGLLTRTCLIITLLAAPAAPAAAAAPLPGAETLVAAGPAAVFDLVVERYRAIASYEDRVDARLVTTRGEDEPRELVTRLFCRLHDDQLQIRTPARQGRKAVRLDLPFRSTAVLQDLLERYDLWMAPHMGLNRLEHPLREFRRGIDEGFEPVSVRAMTVDEQRVVRLRIAARTASGEKSRATFDLDIDPISGLVLRVEGRQQLLDDGRLHIVLSIMPQHVAWKSDREPSGDTWSVSEPTSVAGGTPVTEADDEANDIPIVRPAPDGGEEPEPSDVPPPPTS